jgi:hypothetical protein
LNTTLIYAKLASRNPLRSSSAVAREA